MPIIKLSKGCFKFGQSGKKYCGPGAKTRALRQGRAIKASQARARKGR